MIFRVNLCRNFTQNRPKSQPTRSTTPSATGRNFSRNSYIWEPSGNGTLTLSPTVTPISPKSGTRAPPYDPPPGKGPSPRGAGLSFMAAIYIYNHTNILRSWGEVIMSPPMFSAKHSDFLNKEHRWNAQKFRGKCKHFFVESNFQFTGGGAYGRSCVRCSGESRGYQLR